MLVLARKPEEAVRLTLPSGEVIRVKVLRLINNQVKIAFDAPREISIVREELLPEEDEDPREAA